MIRFKYLSISLFFTLINLSVKSQNHDCIEPFSHYDTITLNGNHLKYHIQSRTAQLEYGNKVFHRFLPEKYSCDIADSRVPKFQWDNTDFMGLHYGCGVPCWGVLILPLNSTDPIRNIMYDLATDPTNNLIAYLDSVNYDKIVIENLKTKISQIVEFTKKSDAAFVGSCIDSISIRNNELYYQFAEPNKFDKNKRVTEFRIKIK